MTKNSTLDRLEPAFDRFQEAHFWIHGLERYYHQAEPFRWHLNVFIKAIKEIVPLVRKALQNESGFKDWFEPFGEKLSADPLLRHLFKNRDYVVHHGMLALESSGSLGITEGRGIKLGLNFPVNPNEDSDDAMGAFIRALAVNGDFLGFLAEDEDSLPCVERYWRLPGIDEDVVDACARAWLILGETMAAVAEWCGIERPQFNLQCRHSSQQLHFKVYNRKSLRAKLLDLRAQPNFVMAADAHDAAPLSMEDEN
ncbi:hypothetical protein MKK65_00910 [Methylobacterium sp. J-001]|uniref:hypothetical protein n=1 Tax=Methylobacterium sp. J-001 TaxID=2836609 RepID=UPI001FBAE81E|nr:hypothetical protein [Methylobacterium sp. J-001]MCJ2115171.1 hypothetical protein [Methylobacterium sp. J-001]